MAKTTIYGIKNCDTMKKAFQWLDVHKVQYVFHDYKKDGADAMLIKRAIKVEGWENVLNRKGMTWRGVSEKIKNEMNEVMALKIALENPTIIRRPVLISEDKILLGFNEKEYVSLLHPGV